MEAFSFVAVGAGLGAALLLTALAGMILGVAISADLSRAALKDDPSLSDEALAARVDEALKTDLPRPAVLTQLIVLSLVGAAIGGAVTVLVAGHSGWLNPALTAVGLGALNLYPTKLLPLRPRLVTALLTLPATGFGAYLMTIS
ncbi:MAG: hypothetical protein ACRBCL_09990 [Maritimibacter sp.]